jgi:curli biogenesis system outer membrane secretion channel CsgG
MARHMRGSILTAAVCAGLATIVGWPASTGTHSPMGGVANALAAGPGSHAAVTTVPADFRKDPLEYYFDDRFSQALTYGEAVLADRATSRALREHVLVTMATIRLAQGHTEQARTAFGQLLAQSPTAELEQPARLPPDVRQLFYKLRDSMCVAQQKTLVASGHLHADLRTLAIGDIEDNSIVKGSFNTDHFCRGLAQVMISDLQGATPLKLVDRQRLQVLLDELKISKDAGLVAPDTRVQLGLLCGAQTYLFGQFMLLDHNRGRLDLRWVNTATGEILLAEGVEGSIGNTGDLFKLERKLLVEMIAPRIQRLVDSTQAPQNLQRQIEMYLDKKQRTLPSSSAYATVLETRGRAEAQERSGDLKAAAASWEKVAAMDPSDATSKTRARSLTAYDRVPRN